MLRYLRDTLLCCLLGVCILLLLELRLWVIERGLSVDDAISHLDQSTRSLDQLLSENRPAVRTITSNLSTTTSNLSTTTANAASATSQINTLIDHNTRAVNKIIVHVDEVVGEAGNAAKALAQASRDITDEQQDVANATLGTIRETTSTVHALHLTVDALDQQISDPDISRSIGNIALITGSISDLSADAVKVERRYFFPPPYQGNHRVLHGILTTGFGVVKTLTPLAEFGYYGTNMSIGKQ